MPSSFCRNSVKKTLVNVCFQIIYSYKCFLARIKRSVDDILHALLTEVLNFFAPSPKFFIQYLSVIGKWTVFLSKEKFSSRGFYGNLKCSVDNLFEKRSLKVGLFFLKLQFSNELFSSMSFYENIECSVNKRFEKNSVKVGIFFLKRRR